MNQKLSTQRVATKAPRQRASRTRSALAAALLELLGEQALEQITVRQITARANVGYATFFRNYADKEALLHDLAAGEISKLLSMTLPLFYTVDSRSSTQALCTYIWENRGMWVALLTGGAASTLKEVYLQQALEQLNRPGQPHSWLPDDLAVTWSVTGIVEILAWWLKQAEPLPIAQMAEIVNRLTVLPVFADPPR